MEKLSSKVGTVIGKFMSKKFTSPAFSGDSGLESSFEKRKNSKMGAPDYSPLIDQSSHPYRSSQKPETKVNKRRKPTSLPGATEIVLAVVNLNLAGFTGEYLSRNLPESHFSCSGFFCGMGFVVLALFFGYRGWIKTAHSLNRFRR